MIDIPFHFSCFLLVFGAAYTPDAHRMHTDEIPGGIQVGFRGAIGWKVELYNRTDQADRRDRAFNSEQ
jgi:hypothetical protein